MGIVSNKKQGSSSSTPPVDISDTVNAVADIGTTPNAKGLTKVGRTLNIEPASKDFGGSVSTGTQQIAGDKEFYHGANDNMKTSSGRLAVNISASATIFAGQEQISSEYGLRLWHVYVNGLSYIQGNHSSGIYYPLALQSQGGKVGIGTDAPDTTLHVNGTIKGNAIATSFVTSDAVPDSNYTIVADYTELGTITANRNATMPDPTLIENSGRTMIVKNKNSSGFAWSFATAVKDKTDSNFTTMANDTVYILFSNGSVWSIIAIY